MKNFINMFFTFQTICFGPGYKKDVLEVYNWQQFPKIFPEIDISMEDLYSRSTYDIGQDFKIEIVSNHFESGKVNLISEGFHEIYKWENSTLNVDVKSIVTWAYGKCYKLIFHSNLIGYSYLSINLTLKDNLKSKPKALQIFITSEKNSDGVVPGIWFEGKEMLIESNFGQNYELWINLGLKDREYLPEISKCTNSTFYECIGNFLNKSKK